MKLITHSVFLVAVHLIAAKQFKECEFAIELYSKHQVPREDIYKHLCIGSNLHTSTDSYSYIGIYRISRQWWCGNDAPGGGCNVKCSDLVDDDIADDVICANLILSEQGLGAWGESETSCKRKCGQMADDCLGTDDELTAPTTTEKWNGYVSRRTTTEKWIFPRTTPTTTITSNEIRSIFFLIIALAGIVTILSVWFKNRKNS